MNYMNVLSSNLHTESKHALKNLPNMESIICKTTNSRPKLQLNQRITLIFMKIRGKLEIARKLKGMCTSLMYTANAAKMTDATKPASVPSKLTAPSVPLGTIDKVVTKYLHSQHHKS